MKLRRTTKEIERRVNTVLIRIDADVPMKNGRIRYHGDDRLKAALPEIQKWRGLGKQVIVMGHAGRPGGVRKKHLSLAPIAVRLTKLLGEQVQLVDVKVAQKTRHEGTGIILLENLRFHSEEKKNSKRFAKQLAGLADVYVNNAFSVCHRKHASVHAIHDYIDGYAGESVLREVKELSRPLRKPQYLVLGGIKLETRLALLEHLADRADGILLGSGIAAVISGNHKVNFSPSLRERRIAKMVLKKYAEKLVFPVDIRYVKGAVADIGPKTITHYKQMLAHAKSIVWNGPLGQIELAGGMKGTFAFGKALQHHEARVLIGGGDTIGYLRKRELLNGIDFVSSGGGAMLQFLARKEMPGLEKLKI